MGVSGSPTPSSTATTGGSATPTPTATPATICSFIWENVTATTVSFYEVDIDSSLWMSGTVDLDGDLVSAHYLLGEDQNGGFTSAGVATSGSISITVQGMQTGAQASMTGAATLTFFDATGVFKGTATDLGAQTATGGTGSFTGTLSDLASTTATPTFGTGTAQVKIGNNNTTFGGAMSQTVDDVAGCATGP